MSRFTYSNSVKNFNGSCTSKLLFDNKDGSTNRIFCAEDTCVSAVLTPSGAAAACNSVMKPSGYLLEKFDWGLSGGPWGPVSIDYGFILPSPNEFVADGSKFTKPSVISSGVASCAMRLDSFGRKVFKSDAFNPGTWDIQDTSNAGYSALAEAALNAKIVDPAAALGKNKYLPANYYPDGCSVQATAYEEPDITYYDVGVDPIPPEDHDVTFYDVSVAVGSGDGSLYTEFPTEYAFYSGCVQPVGLCGVIYNIACHGTPDMVALSGAWTYSPASGGGNRNARSYDPTRDRDPTNIVTRGIRSDTTFVTGYRMQKYVQLFHTAKLTTSSASVSVGMRDIETRIRPLGYRAKWRFKSVNLDGKTVYVSGSRQKNFYVSTFYFTARADVTITVSYEKIPNPPSRNTYEYGPYRDTVPTEYQRLYWSESYHEHEYEYIPVSTLFKKKYFNPPFQGWLREFTPTPYQPWPYPVITGGVTGTHYVIGQVSTTTPPAWYPAGQTHEHKTPFKSLTSVVTAKNYKLPLKWRPITSTNLRFQCSGYYRAVVDPTYISYGGQLFTRLGNVFYPNPAILYASFPGTPDNFQIWRKLITDGSTYVAGGQFSLGYSSRTEWFNGTCPFDVNYDNSLSSKNYLRNLCESTIVPYIMPTG